MLVGNKRDLVHERQVGEGQGKDAAREMGVAWVEASAKDNDNVDLVFVTLVRAINKWRKEHPDKQAKKDKKRCIVL